MRSAALGAALAGAAGLAIGVSACGEAGARPTATLTAVDSADQVLQGFSHYVTSDGIRRTRIDADTAYLYEASQKASLRGVRSTFYDTKGAETSRLTADRGTYAWQDGSMDAEGHVVVTTPDGRRLETEALKFDNKQNRISTDKPFRFQRGDEHIVGNSFSSDPDFKNVVTDRPHGVAGKGILLPGQQ
ncbi:MAG TPA: LPS export ABC transporter periplasmic protein LptC [Gemmatimonadales bacterium]|nr:LPS export ABC transporter periplasmic protein LptC [Gemmatimonadales bacterium]